MPVLDADDVVTLEEAKAHLRVDHDYEDDLILIYRDAAIADLSEFMRRPILPKIVADYFQWGDLSNNQKKVQLRYPNATNVVVELYSGSGYSEVSDTEYRVEEPEENGHVIFYTAPNYDDGNANGNILRVGYTSQLDTLPPQIKAAVLLMLGHLYENREAVVVGSSARKVPMSVEYLLRPLRFWRY